MLQVQAAQQRALNTNLAAGAPNIGTPHLSPGFAQRAPVSSPVVSHSSPPRTSTTPNPPRPSSASQHQGHAQPSPSLPYVAGTRQNLAPGMYYPPLPLTQEQMDAMRYQFMVSGCFYLYCGPEASTATAYDDAAPSPASSSSSSSPNPSPSPGTGRSTGWIVPTPALKLPTSHAPRQYIISHCPLQLYLVE